MASSPSFSSSPSSSSSAYPLQSFATHPPHVLTMEASAPTTEPFLRLFLKQLSEVYDFCLEIGKHHTDALMQLSAIAQPMIPADQRVPVLKSMFDDLPGFFHSRTEQELFLILRQGHSPLLALDHLRALRQVVLILDTITYTQLIQLSTYEPPPDHNPHSFLFVRNLHDMFRTWTVDDLRMMNAELRNVPLHMERQTLLRISPQIPWDMLNFVVELMKLPMLELEDLQKWIGEMNSYQIDILTRLIIDFKNQSTSLLELKGMLRLTRCDTHEWTEHNVSNLQLQFPASPLPLPSQNLSLSLPPSQLPSQKAAAASVAPQQKGVSLSRALPESLLQIVSGLKLRLSRQPPPKTVYQRIVRPFPSVLLEANQDQFPGPYCSLFVEATLIRNDNNSEVPNQLEGTRVSRIDNAHFATFKKLKIMSTTQQLGTVCRIKFTLKVFINGVMEMVPSCHVISTPIEVFSHTLYLNGKAQLEQNPQVTEIIPPEGPPGCRCIVLGNHFKNEKNIQVFFGKQLAQNIRWHESGAILCNSPPFAKVSPNPTPPSLLSSFASSSSSSSVSSSPWSISDPSSSSSSGVSVPMESDAKQMSLANPSSVKEEESRLVVISVANDTSSAIFPSEVRFLYLDSQG